MCRLIVVVALFTLGCGGGSSPTAPAPTPSTNPTPTVDAKAVCGLALTNREDTVTVTRDATNSILGITNINPRNDAGKAFVRLTWQAGIAPIAFHVTALSVDTTQPVQYRGETIATSTPESPTSATACWNNPVAVDAQVNAAVPPGIYTITVHRSYPQR